MVGRLAVNSASRSVELMFRDTCVESFPTVTRVSLLWLPDSGRNRNVENKGVGEADGRDVLEEAKQDAVRHLQVGLRGGGGSGVCTSLLTPFVLRHSENVLCCSQDTKAT